MQKITDSTVTEGSGNVFADIGLRNPAGLLLRANLVIALSEEIENRNLKTENVADTLGVPYDRLVRLLTGDTRHFPVNRLTRMLNRIEIDISGLVSDDKGKYVNGRPNAVRPTFAATMRQR